jgi:hypothetical protein
MIKTLCLLLALTTAATAQDLRPFGPVWIWQYQEQDAEIFSLLVIYNEQCAKLSASELKPLGIIHDLVDSRVLGLAIINQRMKTEKIGREKWCEIARPAVKAAGE